MATPSAIVGSGVAQADPRRVSRRTAGSLSFRTRSLSPRPAVRFIKAIPVLYRPSDEPVWLRGMTVDISDSGMLLEAAGAGPRVATGPDARRVGCLRRYAAGYGASSRPPCAKRYTDTVHSLPAGHPVHCGLTCCRRPVGVEGRRLFSIPLRSTEAVAERQCLSGPHVRLHLLNRQIVVYRSTGTCS
jgi:hypothetical protein